LPVPFSHSICQGHGAVTTDANDLFEWNIEYLEAVRFFFPFGHFRIFFGINS
jgi:hypothetical protein